MRSEWRRKIKYTENKRRGFVQACKYAHINCRYTQADLLNTCEFLTEVSQHQALATPAGYECT